jgi:hypothetical protein
MRVIGEVCIESGVCKSEQSRGMRINAPSALSRVGRRGVVVCALTDPQEHRQQDTRRAAGGHACHTLG